jgi:hypothetical protein
MSRAARMRDLDASKGKTARELARENTWEECLTSEELAEYQASLTEGYPDEPQSYSELVSRSVDETTGEVIKPLTVESRGSCHCDACRNGWHWCLYDSDHRPLFDHPLPPFDPSVIRPGECNPWA